MAFLTSLKRALGFTDGEDDEDLLNDEPNIFESSHRRDNHGIVNPFAKPHNTPNQQGENTADADTEGASTAAANSDATMARLQQDINKLQTDLRKAHAERDDARSRQLSAERRMRALNDRVAEYEKRIASLQDSVAEAQKAPVAADPKPAEISNADLAQENETLREEIKRRDVKIAELSAAIADEKHSNAVLSRDVDTIKMKSELAEAMVADLTSQLSQTKRDLAAANSEEEMLEKMAAQMEKLQELVSKKDLRIAELQRSLGLRNKELESLNSTIEHNLRHHAKTQELLRHEIESLRAGTTFKPSKSVADDVEKAPDSRKRDADSGKKTSSPPADGQLSLF